MPTVYYELRGGTCLCNIRSTLGLDRFTLRGRKKVNSQWNMFCLVHNLMKIHRYGPGYAYELPSRE